MNTVSEYKDLLSMLTLLQTSFAAAPRFYPMGDRELIVHVPGAVCSLGTLYDMAGDVMVRCTDRYDMRFTGFSEDGNYRQVRIRTTGRGILGWDMETDGYEGDLRDLAVRIFPDHRDEMVNLLSSLDFSSRMFVIERNSFTEKCFESDLENTQYIFLLDGHEGTVLPDIMNTRHFERLFDRFFRDGCDSMEFWWIRKSGKYTNSMLIGLRISMTKNDVVCTMKEGRVSFFRNGERVMYSYDGGMEAERVMMRLLFADGEDRGLVL